MLPIVILPYTPNHPERKPDRSPNRPPKDIPKGTLNPKPYSILYGPSLAAKGPSPQVAQQDAERQKFIVETLGYLNPKP